MKWKNWWVIVWIREDITVVQDLLGEKEYPFVLLGTYYKLRQRAPVL
jgi:hypothetical protein